jgi:3'-phosphoadenosine 5'-phosphosulfate sulfotransferase (PAPS reductase)/FAD synthetase
MEQVTNIVPISGGKDSTALALRLKELNPDIDYQYVITPTGDELPEMEEHWKNLETLLGKKLIRLHAEYDFYELIERKMALPAHHSRWCTEMLKLIPVNEYYREVSPAITYVGLRADEDFRKGNSFYDDDVKQCFPMQEWGWRIGDVYSYLAKRGVTIPRRTDCGCCFWQRIDEWYSLWEQYPERFKKYEDLEFLVGHTFMTPGKHTKWSHRLFELRCQFERGEKPTAVIRREKLNKRLKKQPNFFMQPSEPFDYNMTKRCAVCSL